jgi:diguanylate cyclase (GGDEF)-like protein/PAS domain S-box-containing protein
MLTRIRNRLDVKIILSLSFVMALMIGIYTYNDIRNMQMDTVLTAERTLGAFAAAIKGGVNASMKSGHHEDVKQILDEVNRQSFVDRVLIYNEEGRPLRGVETSHSASRREMDLSAGILQSVVNGDLTDIRQQGGTQELSYYAPLVNLPECFRCHGSQAKLNGVLRIDFSLRDLDDLIAVRRNRDILWSAILFVLLTSLLGVLLRIVVYRPVKELRDAMVKVHGGADPPAFSIAGHDELADLKRSFVEMLHRVTVLHQTNLEKELIHSQEMRRLRAELQNMFDAMPDGILLINSELKIVQSNPRAYELLPELKIVGDRIQTERLKEMSCPHYNIQQAFQRAGVRQHQCTVKLPDGQTRHVHSICAPVIEDGRVAYIVEVIRDITESVKLEHELEEKTAELIAANKTLSKIANTDSLTQVYNRHRFDDILTTEIKRYKRRKYSALSLMMIDIDHFKQLNDRYGHLAGDAALREIASMLKEEMRGTDTVARFGGEEFVVVMPATDLAGAAHKAEMLRRKTEATEFPGADTPIHMTVSIGVAVYASGSPSGLINAADQALYRAKQAGRNKVVVSGPESEVTET